MTRADVFFDTNILVYLLDDDAAKAERSEALLAEGGLISVQVLNEFVHVMRRKFRASWAEVSQMSAGFRKACTVVPLDVDTHARGLVLATRYNLSVYDAMIVAAAQIAGCGLLYTEDMQNGLKLEGLTITNPYA